MRTYLREAFGILIAAAITFSFMQHAQAKSVTREGEAVVTFGKLNMPEVLKQGQFYLISADMSIKKNLWEEMSVFVHIVSQQDNKLIINNDFALTVPATQWTPGETITVGPANAYIPDDIPPGTYNVQMGLFAVKHSNEGDVFVREPYTDPAIKNFVVGTIKVEESPAEKVEKKPDLVVSDFESKTDVKKWEVRGAHIEQDADNAATGKYAGKITFLKNKGDCPAAILQSFFRYSDPKYSNWAEYDILQFYCYGGKDAEGRTYLNIPVTLQIKDKEEKRYQVPIPGNSEKDKPVTFTLSNIGKTIDLSDVGNLTVFVVGTPPDNDLIAYIDDIRLISLGLEKEKNPTLKFEGLALTKNKIKAGEDVEFTASFSTAQRFAEDYGLFIHIYKSIDKSGWINADTSPTPPTTEWEVNKVIAEGPFSVYVPPTAPTGTYSIEMGLFLTKTIPFGSRYVKYYRNKDGVYFLKQPSYPTDYFRLPYVNYTEYGDWVVGTFEVAPPE